MSLPFCGKGFSSKLALVVAEQCLCLPSEKGTKKAGLCVVKCHTRKCLLPPHLSPPSQLLRFLFLLLILFPILLSPSSPDFFLCIQPYSDIRVNSSDPWTRPSLSRLNNLDGFLCNWESKQFKDTFKHSPSQINTLSLDVQ